jgi:hypothetical protein
MMMKKDGSRKKEAEDAMANVERPDERSLGQLFAKATTEMSALVHEEVALAKAELRADAKRAGLGGGALGVAAVLGLVALPLWGFAAAYGIHNLGLGLAWAFLIVGGGFVALAGLLAVFARAKFQKVKPPERSIASAKETAAVLQGARPHQRTIVAGHAEPADRAELTAPSAVAER